MACMAGAFAGGSCLAFFYRLACVAWLRRAWLVRLLAAFASLSIKGEACMARLWLAWRVLWLAAMLAASLCFLWQLSRCWTRAGACSLSSAGWGLLGRLALAHYYSGDLPPCFGREVSGGVWSLREVSGGAYLRWAESAPLLRRAQTL